MNKPDNSKIGLCPKCGSVPAEDWVKGEAGWICGSYFLCRRYGKPAEYIEGDRFIQSIPCAVMHWRTRAEKAEAELRKMSEPS